MRHKMTFSHFSKDLIRPNLGGESKRNLYSDGGVIWEHRVSRRDEVCEIFCGFPFV